MRLKLLFAALLALLPVPALADTTARYSAGEKDTLMIEADDGGNMRAGMGEKFAIIRRDGVDYILVADATGAFKVGKLADVLGLLAGQMKGMGAEAQGKSMTFQLRAGGEESVAGYSGAIWLFGPAPVPGKPDEKPIEMVMSADPALAPIGAAFRHIAAAIQPMLGAILGDASNFEPLFGELLGKGTPIRMGPLLKLDSVSTGEIPVERFELPGPVLEPMEFLQAVTLSQSGSGMPPLP